MTLYAITALALAVIFITVGAWPRKAEAKRLTDDRRTIEQLSAGSAIAQAFADIALEKQWRLKVRLNVAKRRQAKTVDVFRRQAM